MKKKYRVFIIISVIGMLLITLCILLIEIILSNATSLCPLSHRLNMDMYCVVHDTINDSVLVEHFNIDNNLLELSINSRNRSIWIKHPFGEAKSYVERIKDNRIRFDRNNANRIIVNDKDTLKIEILKID